MMTCHRFEEDDAYKEVYHWFNHLQKDDCVVLGFVIVPNHIHCLFFPTNENKYLNKLVSEGKRSMAYGIVKGLKQKGKADLLKLLSEGVQHNEREKGKKHQVFNLSFDGELCAHEKMFEQKLDETHRNPVSSKWKLVDDFTNYPYSSAAFYELGKENELITQYKEL